jgi:HSP20 family molecular chaperone IbpA
MESQAGGFSRCVTLPKSADLARIAVVSLINGVLLLRCPRKATHKQHTRRQIQL